MVECTTDIHAMNETDVTRTLRSNYGTFNASFKPPSDIALNILEFMSMDTAVQYAVCDSSCNHIHQQRMHQLFGGMNDLLSSDESCFYSKWKMKQKLNKIPTFKQIYINISYLTNPNNVRDIWLLFHENNYEFVRGIDVLSRLPFLIFIVSTDVALTQQRIQKRLVIALFDHNGIHSILYSPNMLNVNFYRRFTYFNSQSMDDDVKIITISDIIHLIKREKVYNVFNIPNSVWIHNSHALQRRETLMTYQEYCFVISALMSPSILVSIIGFFRYSLTDAVAFAIFCIVCNIIIVLLFAKLLLCSLKHPL